jgi:arsenite-transporting ATPase
MSKIQVFDPAMCCNTGICGPEADPSLLTFAADVEWLNARGTEVERINLAQQPQAFADHPAILRLLETQGEKGLPAVVVNGEIRQSGCYPSRDQLVEWAGLPSEASLVADAVAARVPVGVPIAASVQDRGACCGSATRQVGSTTTKCC